jgi:hypothetical protein
MYGQLLDRHEITKKEYDDLMLGQAKACAVGGAIVLAAIGGVAVAVEAGLVEAGAAIASYIVNWMRFNPNMVNTATQIVADVILPGPSPTAGFSRALTAADFGTRATLKAIEGTLKVEGKIATVTVKNIEGNLGNAWDALDALKTTVRTAGATTLRLEVTIANTGLLRALERLLGPAARGTSGGAQDVWEIVLGN